MSGTRRRCDVVVMGAGLAGLTAAMRLTHAGAAVRVLEAGSAIGGRVHGEQPEPGLVLDTGAEFVGHPHRHLRRLLAELDLRTTPSRLGRAPLLWRLPDRTQIGRLPPLPLRDLVHLACGWSQLRRRAAALDPKRPWHGPAPAELDQHILADWLAGHGVTRAGLEATEALISGFATVSTGTLSAAHTASWIAAAGGLIPALRSGAEHLVDGGAHQIPQRLADRLDHHPALHTTVTAVREHTRGVEIITGEATWAADAAVIAVPLPALRQLMIEPAPPAAFTTALRTLAYGAAVKIAARAAAPPPGPHRAVLGGHPLAVAWRDECTLAGINITGVGTPTDLAADLAAAFELDPDDLTAVAVTDWAAQTWIGGSYLTYGPGQLTRHAAALNAPASRRVRFAGSDHSSWPNSMEGAVQSGEATAHGLLTARRDRPR